MDIFYPDLFGTGKEQITGILGVESVREQDPLAGPKEAA
jgi:hypothetical protein